MSNPSGPVDAGESLALVNRLIARGGHRLLEHWISGGTMLRSTRQKTFAKISRALDAVYYAQDCTVLQREGIKKLCMGRESGVAWAKKYLQRGFPDEFTPHLPMFKKISALLEENAVASVHQVACCSGREIAFYARCFPKIRFVGSDCDEALVAFLRQQWAHLQNLSFEIIRMDSVPFRRPTGLECDLLIASGGFHYMDPASLGRFFQAASAAARLLVLSQPMRAEYPVFDAASSEPRAQLSWNHPYPLLLSQNGWTEIEAFETFLPTLPGLKNFTAFAQSRPFSSPPPTSSLLDPLVSETRKQ